MLKQFNTSVIVLQLAIYTSICSKAILGLLVYFIFYAGISTEIECGKNTKKKIH